MSPMMFILCTSRPIAECQIRKGLTMVEPMVYEHSKNRAISSDVFAEKLDHELVVAWSLSLYHRCFWLTHLSLLEIRVLVAASRVQSRHVLPSVCLDFLLLSPLFPVGTPHSSRLSRTTEASRSSSDWASCCAATRQSAERLLFGPRRKSVANRTCQNGDLVILVASNFWIP